MIDMVGLSLRESLYPASLARLGYSLDEDFEGVEVSGVLLGNAWPHPCLSESHVMA